MFTQNFLFDFLTRQKRDLLAAAGSAGEPAILLEARGYAGGKKVTQFLETINKALHSGGHDHNNWQKVRDILDLALPDQQTVDALLLEVRDSLHKLGMPQARIDRLLTGLDQPPAT